MNFLAHLYLSGSSDEVKIGNFIGDYVKGKNYEKYPSEIQKGILLHRGIDTFTDKHPIIRHTKSYFQSEYGKYAGIIVDILFDHFLYLNWKLYSTKDLVEFITEIHGVLRKYFSLLPKAVQKFVPSFIEKDWIRAYKTINGIELVLSRMSLRTSLPDNTRSALKLIDDHHDELDKNFNEYFPLLIDYVKKEFEIDIGGL